MAAYLVEQCGYGKDDMVILTDDRQGPMSQPTKRNILQAMHWLVKGAAPNDSLFFHYSGESMIAVNVCERTFTQVDKAVVLEQKPLTATSQTDWVPPSIQLTFDNMGILATSRWTRF